MKSKELFTIGIDFGTDSVRAIIVNTNNGDVIASASEKYKRWSDGKYCDPKINQFRQHPLDHLESLKLVIQNLLKKVSSDLITDIKAISIASTASTPIAVDSNGTPLALINGFEDNPNAMFILWKDHTAIKEAKEINDLVDFGSGMDYTKYVGGEYSSEWFWAKMLSVLRKDEKVRNAAYSWVEHCDWIPGVLTGIQDPLKMKRSRCAAGHKAMWHSEWDGLPPDEFFSKIDPLLSGVRDKLYHETYTADQKAGTISREWAELFGFENDVLIGVGSVDAHMGALGGGIRPNYLVKVIGTSTCDMVVIPGNDDKETIVSGICGQVDGSILPGMLGLEAGQSAFGDIYAWFNSLLFWPIKNVLSKNSINQEIKDSVIEGMKSSLLFELSEKAKLLPINEDGVVALDWMNGRRTPNSNQGLRGGFMGLSLSTDPPELFKALVEATCFGSKKILDRFIEEGVHIEGVIAIGGVAQKSDFVMQTLSDVLNYPISIAKSEETCALGSAMAAAVVSGIYASFLEAQKAMGSGFEKTYHPIALNVKKYERLYERYSEFASFIETTQVTR